MDEPDTKGTFGPEDLEAFPGAADDTGHEAVPEGAAGQPEDVDGRPEGAADGGQREEGRAAGADRTRPDPDRTPREPVGAAEVNPWNGPIDPAYGDPEPMPGSTKPRYRMGAGAVALIVVAVVVAAVAIAFAGPRLLGSSERDADELEAALSGADPLDHGPRDDAPGEDLPEELLGDGAGGGEPVDPDGLDASERAAWEAVDARLGALAAGDQVEMDLIASLVSEGFASQMGDLTLTDCGVDATEYARVMTEGLTYTIDDVYVGVEGDSALVSATVTCRDVFSVIDGFNAMMAAYKGSEEFETSTYEQDIERVGIMFMEAARIAPLNDGYRMDFVLAADGDGWAINESAWELELDYLFDVE